MELRVLGCHGGETPAHRTSAFLIDGKVGIDAGALTSELTLAEQRRVQSVLVSHCHMDHIQDLATMADTRCQAGGPTLQLAGTEATIGALKAHFFNDLLWPDFTKIKTPKGPTIRYLVLKPEVTYDVSGYSVRAVLVSHTVESAAFVVRRGRSTIAYSGDTGPTTRLWEVLRSLDLKALLMEVSFPNAQQRLATASGHHTPRTLASELDKLGDRSDLPILLFHIKPTFERAVLRELTRIRGRNLSILHPGDTFIL
ncbi:MAG: 3',5'-cyclic-nucleotide phosphodiesterase [Deltaproteobacteria bacterium]|nr:3',5'-cyclic-nucleotide phosphodiesterase [Deltaproteobacteria bacterium]